MADHDPHDASMLIRTLGLAARYAADVMRNATTAQKSAGLLAAAAAIRDQSTHIMAENARDLVLAEANGVSPAMLDRLRLDAARISAIADATAAVAHLPDPVGHIIDHSIRPNGLQLQRIRVPLGVIGIIYESRPNVTVDAAALGLMAGNTVILRGGSEAVHSNRALHAAFCAGLRSSGLPADAAQLVPTQDRAAVGAMLRAAGLIDIIIPRGGKSLVARVQDEARIPVLAHLDGICHTYVDGAANVAMASTLVVNAKMRRTGICGATETVLIDRAFPEPAALITALIDAGCAVRGDADVCALHPAITPATIDDWGTEYLDAIVSVALVGGVDAACAHIAAHGSHHTDAIITENAGVAEKFLNQVDSAIVIWNASTQFADGGEFGLGAEIGISTGRMHARGPVALEGLTTYKWQVRGSGQLRP